MQILLANSIACRKFAAFLGIIAIITMFAAKAFAFPIAFDPQNYEGRYEVFLKTGGLTGPQSVELAPGTYSLRIAIGNQIFFTVDATGGVSTTNPDAITVGQQSVTFKNVTITIDPGLFEHNNSDRYGIRFLKSFVTGANILGPQIVTVVPNLPYRVDLGVNDSFGIEVDAAGNVTVPNGVSGIGGAQLLTFNTRTVTINPASYALNSNPSFAFRFIHNFSPSGGAQQIFLVPGVSNYQLILGCITCSTGFSVAVDGTGNVSAVNGVSATGGVDSLTINTVPIAVDQHAYALNSAGALSVRFIHSFASATSGPQTVYLAPGVSNYPFVVGVLTGGEIFNVEVDGSGVASATNGVSATGGVGFLDINTVDVTVDPNGFTGDWTVRFIHSASGVDLVRLVPGVNAYLLGATGVAFQPFNVANDGEPIPSTVPFNINNQQFNFLLIAGGSPPVADAGVDQTVDEGELVTLDGSQSFDPQGDTLAYQWSQIAGPSVSLVNAQTSGPIFTAPAVGENSTVTLQLIVTDGVQSSEPATVSISIKNSNSPPISDAGDDATVKAGAPLQLNGANSFDPDGDDINYQWLQASGPIVNLSNPYSSQPGLTAPLSAGTNLVFKLVVSDALESSVASPGVDSSFADTVLVAIVENSAPIADAGPDQNKAEGASVLLDASQSSDPDGDGISFAWSQVSGLGVTLNNANTVNPSFTAPILSGGGVTLEFRVTVTDDDSTSSRSDSDVVAINLVNVNDPPSCNLAEPSVSLLWPPNHKFSEVAITGVEDPDTGLADVSLTITGITQDEPTNGTGDGDTGPDGIVKSNGLDFDRALIRAERDGTANGRVYEVAFTATDGQESCQGRVQVSTPHNRKDLAVDDGQNFVSTE